MKISILSLFLCICCILIQCAKTDLLDNPPKDKAEIFAPGIVSLPDKEHSKLSVAPDGKSLYCSLVILPYNEGEERQIGFVTMKNGKWRVRELTQFGNVTSDGKYLFFTSRRRRPIELPLQNPITYEEKMKMVSSPGNSEGDIYWVDAKIIDKFKKKLNSDTDSIKSEEDWI